MQLDWRQRPHQHSNQRFRILDIRPAPGGRSALHTPSIHKIPWASRRMNTLLAVDRYPTSPQQPSHPYQIVKALDINVQSRRDAQIVG